MTEKLYYMDSHLREFTAKVLSCAPMGDKWAVVLDRTAFYPEGGGQPGDRGTLGGVTVTDTREKDGQLIHLCDAPLTPDTTVEGVLDWQRRFSLMQQHSAEHMVSGLLHSTYGYDNVGFHMGKDTVTIDFNGVLTEQQLEELENRVNLAIWENTAVEVTYPTAEELKNLPYRSKKELTGQVRIVHFPGMDLCACCGVHVEHTGEIGLVKFLSCQKFHEGVRIEMLAGAPAVEHLCRVWEQNRRVSNLLSAKAFETAEAVERLQQELSQTKYRLSRLEEQLFAQKAEALRGKGDVVLFEEGLNPDGLRRLADAVQKTCGGRCAVFSPVDGGFQYAMAQTDGDLRELCKALNQQLNGRGGGKPGFVQGSVRADRKDIEAFFAQR